MNTVALMMSFGCSICSMELDPDTTFVQVVHFPVKKQEGNVEAKPVPKACFLCPKCNTRFVSTGVERMKAREREIRMERERLAEKREKDGNSGGNGDDK